MSADACVPYVLRSLIRSVVPFVVPFVPWGTSPDDGAAMFTEGDVSAAGRKDAKRVNLFTFDPFYKKG
jgi:hypothetical protein